MGHLPQVTLKPGKEKPVLARHPWIFSGAIKDEPCSIEPGSIVDVFDARKTFLARGYYNKASQIRVRLLSWNSEEKIDVSFWSRLLREAFMRRTSIYLPELTNAFRLVHAESDLLPGLIIDYYDGWLVFQVLAAGIEKHLEDIACEAKKIINELFSCKGLYERSDEGVRSLEGLPMRKGPMQGSNNPPSDGISIKENGLSYLVDVIQGHKTGFYLDQRNNRNILFKRAKNLRILNCFCYTGGFSMAGLAGDAREIISVDSSEKVLELLGRNLSINKLDSSRNRSICGDVFEILRKFRAEGELFDLIVLDPPKFVQNASQLNKGTRGYKDINFQALHLLSPSGQLMTFSCSGLVPKDLLQKIIAGAAVDAKKTAQIIKHLGPGEDHPVLLSCPEADYLKGFILRRV